MNDSSATPALDGLWVRDHKVIQFVPFETITHIQYSNGRSKLHANGDVLKELRLPIGELEQRMPRDRFIRTHRNYIINGACIGRYDRDTSQVCVGENVHIPISRRKKKHFVQFIHKTRNNQNSDDHGRDNNV